jgi:hypothetical protein
VKIYYLPLSQQDGFTVMGCAAASSQTFQRGKNHWGRIGDSIQEEFMMGYNRGEESPGYI